MAAVTIRSSIVLQPQPRPPLGLLPEPSRARFNGVSIAHHEDVEGHPTQPAAIVVLLRTHDPRQMQASAYNRLHKVVHTTQISCSTPGPLTCGREVNLTKRKHSTAKTPSDIAAITAKGFAELLDTCTDTPFADVIHHLPETWKAHNHKGTTITKKCRQHQFGEHIAMTVAS